MKVALRASAPRVNLGLRVVISGKRDPVRAAAMFERAQQLTLQPMAVLASIALRRKQACRPE